MERCVFQVTNDRSEAVKVQLSPVFITRHQLSVDEFEISFIVSIPPLGMSTYIIHKFDGSMEENTQVLASRYRFALFVKKNIVIFAVALGIWRWPVSSSRNRDP